jgi:hypothetical protein
MGSMERLEDSGFARHGSPNDARGPGNLGAPASKPVAHQQQPGNVNPMDILCPFIGTCVNEGKLELDDNGMAEIKQLNHILAGVATFLPRLVLTGAAGIAHAGFFKGWTAKKFDPVEDLKDSFLDHRGDLRILRGGFSQERLDQALSYSTDGMTLTLGDIARAKKAMREDRPGLRGHVLGLTELPVLLLVFGKENEKGDLSMSKEAFSRLYRDRRFPKAWEPEKALTPVAFISKMVSFAFLQAAAPRPTGAP